MRTITLNTVVYDDFMVLNKHNVPVTGLVNSDFTKILYDPDETERFNVTGGIDINVVELGNGLYRVNFIPDKTGNWILAIYNATHFPYGKAENYFCVEAWFDELAEILKRIVGLSQENYRIIHPVYDTKRNLISGTIKIYPTSIDVDTDTNAIAQYQISATYDNKNQMTGYKVKRTI
jgi:hypothetical protein